MRNLFSRTIPSIEEENAFFRSFLIGSGLLLLVVLAAVFFIRPTFTLAGAVSRGDSLIAIDFSHDPQHRVVISRPFTSSNGSPKPAVMSYGLANVAMAHSPTEYQHIALTTQQWQMVNHWRHAWCQTTPNLRKVASPSRESWYAVAFRCADSGLTETNVKLFTVPLDQMPDAVRTLLLQIANNRYQ